VNGAALLFVATFAQQAAPEKCGPRRDDEPPKHPDATVVALSAGNSRGAWEAGVAWALLAKKKDASLDGLAGTSIGALNALVAGIDACVDTPEMRAPEQSLLWTVWQRMSWDLLFPGDKTCAQYQAVNPEAAIKCSDTSPFIKSDGVFASRAYDVIAGVVASEMSKRQFGECGLKLALQLISDTPGRMKLGDYDVATSRRYVAVELRGVAQPSAKTGEHRILEAFPIKAKTEEGKDAEVPSCGRGFKPLELPRASSNADAPLDTRSLLGAMAGAGAQPPYLTMAPLAYCGTGCTGDPSLTGFCPAGTVLCHDRFLDAAFFDRVPLASALVLDRDAGRYLIVDPTRDGPPPQPSVTRGSDFYKRLIGNLADVSYDYEVQTLERYKQVPPSRVGRIEPGPRLAGDQVRNFGGYLDGRFRAHDFYAGVYDGLLWAACPTCGESERKSKSESERERVSRLLELYGDDLLAWPDRPGQTSWPRSSVGLTYFILSAIDEQHCRGERPELAQCPRIERNRAALAADPIARDLQTIDDALAAAAKAAPDPKSHDFMGGAAFSRELAARGFDPNRQVPFVSAYDHWSFDTVRAVAGRLAAIEGDQGNQTLAGALGFAEYATAIASARVTPGWQLGPATIPDRVLGTGIVAQLDKLLLPYTVAADFATGGGQLGWELGAYRFPGLTWLRAPVLGASLHWFRRTTDDVAFGPTAALGVDLPSAVVSELGARAWWHPVGGDEGWNAFGGEVYARPAFGRIEIGLGARALHCPAGCDSRGMFVNFGIADFNGLLYWTLRAFTGSDSTYESIVGKAASEVPLP
jgi:hypothetical protein